MDSYHRKSSKSTLTTEIQLIKSGAMFVYFLTDLLPVLPAHALNTLKFALDLTTRQNKASVNKQKIISCVFGHFNNNWIFSKMTANKSYKKFWGTGRSDVWNFYKFEVDDNGEFVDRTKAVCMLCHITTPYSGNTTNLSGHLNRHHYSARLVLK